MHSAPSRPNRLNPATRIRIAHGPHLSRPALGDDGIFLMDRQRATKLDRSSLKVVWKVSVERDAGLGFPTGAVILIGRAGNWFAIHTVDGHAVWGPRPLGQCLKWRDSILGCNPLAILDPMTGAIGKTFSLSENILGDTGVSGDVVVGRSIAADAGAVTAYHLGGERVLWQRDVVAEAYERSSSGEPTRMMVADPGTLLLARRDRLFGCSLEDGSIRWDRPLLLPYYLPNAWGGRVIVLSVSHTEAPHLVCLDVQTGETVYDVPAPLIDMSDRPFRGTVHEGQIAFGTRNGRIVVFDLADGRAAWWASYKETLTAPVFVDDRVLTCALDGYLLVFDPKGA